MSVLPRDDLGDAMRPTSRTQNPAAAAVKDVALALPAVGLSEVMCAAALQTRVDRKYVVSVDDFSRLGAELAGRFEVLEIDGRRTFGYESVYFDTDELALYRQHLQGRRRRYKVRTRTYLDTDDTMFEVKLKGHRGQTVKERLPYTSVDRFQITEPARRFLDGLLMEEYGELTPSRLVPSLCTTYSRTTLVDIVGGCRLTCDVNLVCRAHTTRETPRTHVLVESKASGAEGIADRLLADLGVRPVSVSKYCVAVALLYPHLPANPWHRVLMRHFGYGDVRHDLARAHTGRTVVAP